MMVISFLRSEVQLSNLIWSMVTRLGSTVLSFLVLYAVSHSLETDEYGLYVFLFSVGSSLGVILVFGQQTLLIKHYRASGGPGGSDNIELLSVNSLWLALGCGLQLGAAALTYVFNGFLSPPYDKLPIAFIFGAIFTLSEYLQIYFRIQGRFGMALAPRENIWRILCATIIPLLAYFGLLSGGATAIEIAAALLGLLVGYQVLEFLRVEGRTFLRLRTNAIESGQWAKWKHETFFFTSNGFFAAASNYLETILIGILLNLESAAAYFVAYRISMLLTLPVLILDTIGEPHVAARFQENDREGAQKVISLMSAGSFAASLIGGVFIYFVGSFVLAQFDEAFTQHFDVLMVLCAGAIVHSFFGLGTSLNMIAGGERHLLLQRSFVFVAYVVLLIAFGTHFGLLGIAWASVIQLAAVLLIARHWLTKRWGIDSMATTIVRILREHKRGETQPTTK